MNYTSEDFAEDCPEISRKQALRLVREHGADETEFLRDCGNDQHYCTAGVLAWLGY